MNPFIWVLIILMTLDALRELAGASSILGWLLTLVWLAISPDGYLPQSGLIFQACRRRCKRVPTSRAMTSIRAINAPTPFQP
ncbi:TPA: KPN_01571 family protein [Escherichia coli]